MRLLSGHEKIITKSGISLKAGTLNRGFTVIFMKFVLNIFEVLSLYNFYELCLLPANPMVTELPTQPFCTLHSYFSILNVFFSYANEDA
jgi:hypothetical protein